MRVGREGKAATHLGSMLFTRGVSGTRVVASNTKVSAFIFFYNEAVPCIALSEAFLSIALYKLSYKVLVKKKSY